MPRLQNPTLEQRPTLYHLHYHPYGDFKQPSCHSFLRIWSKSPYRVRALTVSRSHHPRSSPMLSSPNRTLPLSFATQKPTSAPFSPSPHRRRRLNKQHQHQHQQAARTRPRPPTPLPAERPSST
ncbi:hypothetical protein VTG60DRAFT_1760 [Thermothelomyces hinnuleus]